MMVIVRPEGAGESNSQEPAVLTRAWYPEQRSRAMDIDHAGSAGPTAPATGTPRPVRAGRLGRIVVAGALAAGAAIGGYSIAGAATSSTSSSDSSSTRAPAATPDAGGRFNPMDPSHGAPGETLLTGDTAAKVKAAAEKAVSGGTAFRVETDSEGSPYEAHVSKTDGTQVTVKVDSDFKVISVDDFGPPARDAAHDGARDATHDASHVADTAAWSTTGA